MKISTSTALLTASILISPYASANNIYDGKISTFENGDHDGWQKGIKSNAQPIVKLDSDGNRYLEIEAFGEQLFEAERDPDSKMKFLNHTNWSGDYSTLGISKIKIRMINLARNQLHMRLFFGSSKTRVMCMTDPAVKLSGNGDWQDLVFTMTQPGLVCGPSSSVGIIDEQPIELEKLKFDINDIFFMSLQASGASDKTIGILGVDDIEALGADTLNYLSNSTNNAQPAILDLNSDVEASGSLINHITDTPQLNNINGVAVTYSINADGKLEVSSPGVLDILRPVSAIMMNTTPGVQYTSKGLTEYHTSNNRRIILYPELHAENELSSLLSGLNLTYEHDGNGNIKVFPQSGSPDTSTWYSVRGSSSRILDQTIATGIAVSIYPQLPGVAFYPHRYQRNGNLMQQDLHSCPAYWDELKTLLTSLEGSSDVAVSKLGEVQVTLNGTKYKARMDAVVSAANGAPLPEKTGLQGVGDLNGDGLPDFKILYLNGQSQNLYLLP